MKKTLLMLLIVMLSNAVIAQNNTFRDRGKCSITARDFVKQKLKYPKEAKFDKDVVHETNGYGNSIILGRVTTKNGFGIQSEYVYKIWMTHNGRNWTDINNWTMTKLILENTSTFEQQVWENTPKPTVNTSPRPLGIIDGVKCIIVESNDIFTRISTSRKITEAEAKKTISKFNITSNLVYFCLPNKTARGEEYAFKNKDLILFY